MKYFNFPSILSHRYIRYFFRFFRNEYIQKFFLIFCIFILQIQIDSLFFSYSLALLLPLFIYLTVAENKFVSFWFLIFIVMLLESYVFLPFGYYMCLYFSIWLVLTATRDSIAWQNPFTLFLVALTVNVWVIVIQLLLLLSRELVNLQNISEVIISLALNTLYSYLFFLFLLSRDYWFLRNMR